MTAVSPEYFVVDYLLGLSSSVLDQITDVDLTFGRMIFRSALPRPIGKTGKRAVTVANAPGASPVGSHVYGSSVQVRLYADHTRDGNGYAEVEDGVDRAWAMFGRFDPLLWFGDQATPLKSGAPIVQSNRGLAPFEGFDHEMDAPYISASYDITIVASPD